MASHPKFEIFRGNPNSPDAKWLESIEGLGAAVARMKELADAFPGPYFVFSSSLRLILSSTSTTPQKKAPDANREDVA